MSLFYVDLVDDGDSFHIQGGWQWDNKKGERVRIANYNAPERGQPGYQEAKRRLESLILRKSVELRAKAIDTYGRLVADVYIDGENVVDLLMTPTR